MLVAMYVRKEALVLSQIKGTECTLDVLLGPQIAANSNTDVSDVINYIKAAQYALDSLDTLPICNRLLIETHAMMTEGIRGSGVFGVFIAPLTESIRAVYYYKITDSGCITVRGILLRMIKVMLFWIMGFIWSRLFIYL